MKKRRCFAISLFLLYMLVVLFSHFLEREVLSDYDFEEEAKIKDTVEHENSWAISEQQGIRRGSYYQCAATEKYLFFSYSKDSCVDAYDFYGEFQFSIILPNYENGGVMIRGEQNKLYVCSKEGIVYVFEGQQEVERYSPQDAEAQGYTGRWFRQQSENRSVQVERDYVSIWEQDRNEIYKIPTPKIVSQKMLFGDDARLISIVIIPLGILFFVCISVILVRQWHNGRKNYNNRLPL